MLNLGFSKLISILKTWSHTNTNKWSNILLLLFSCYQFSSSLMIMKWKVLLVLSYCFDEFWANNLTIKSRYSVWILGEPSCWSWLIFHEEDISSLEYMYYMLCDVFWANNLTSTIVSSKIRKQKRYCFQLACVMCSEQIIWQTNW